MTARRGASARLSEIAPELARVLERPVIITPAYFDASEIEIRTLVIGTRDGTRLATDVWLPPERPVPTIAVRTPYGRGNDGYAGAFMSFARRGYAVVSQDCRGTGASEPDSWDYYAYEPEDSYDLAEWISNQEWFDGFLGACGGSYVGQTQWQMATHPAMTAFVPDVSGLGIAINTLHLHMFMNAYARTVGKGEEKREIPFSRLEADMLEETLATGYFNEPLHRPVPDALLQRFPNLNELDPAGAKAWLWEHYCSLVGAERADFIHSATGTTAITTVDHESLSEIFGQHISHDRHTLPRTNPEAIASSLHGFPMLRTGWYDWGLNDALATWELLQTAAPETIRSRCRLLLTPSAHNTPGYHERMDRHPELHHAYGVSTNVELLLRWYDAVRRDALDEWPKVVYYLMGANEWRAADTWPPPGATNSPLYLHSGGRLNPVQPGDEELDHYVYDPNDPTPTVGGSIVSYVYPPGSVDVSETQARPDVLTYTTEKLEEDIDVAGPLRIVLYASSSACDTDFAARLSDIFPDGRAIQLQNGVLRARYRNLSAGGEPELLEPGHVYRLDIDMWATANRFRAGHRIRLDISSADFPRFDRNTNQGGEPGPPIQAHQSVYHDTGRPSHLILPVLRPPLRMR